MLVRIHGGGEPRLRGGGAHVTHVDASKKSVAWARENAALSGLPEQAVRWIVEDLGKWVRRKER